VDRRAFLGVSAAALAAAPLGLSAHPKAGSRIGRTDVQSIRQGLVDLRRLDDYTGGANTYPLALDQVQRTSALLNSSSYAPSAGTALLDVLAETCQFTSWTAFDAGHHAEARHLAQRAASAASQAGNRILASSALSELSYLTASSAQPREAVQMARASLANAPADCLPAVRIVLTDRLAWACARTGDVAGVQQALGQVEDLHDQRDARAGEEPDWVYWINREESMIMGGRCWAELRQHQRAVPILEEVTPPYDDSHAREVALYRTWLAGCYLDAGDVEQAAASTSQAVDLAGNTASPRTDAWVRGALQRLHAYRDVPSVRDLLERTA